MESGWKINTEISPNCPRCGSSNTKFCYYNNYSLTQPRYFCKGCRRYWTKGGSLRNVPVGGGCRKNRRGNKNLRQSIDGLAFKNSPCGGDATKNPVGHSYDPRMTSYSSSSMVSGPNIDLAVVYANFLTQKPDSGAGVDENHDQIHAVFDHSQENSRLLSNTEIGPSTILPQELGLIGCLNLPEQSSTGSRFCDGNNSLYFSGFNSMQIHQEATIEQCNIHHDALNFELPPLPGEEEVLHDMMWSNSEMMLNHASRATQPSLFQSEAHDDANLLVNNWSPFNLEMDPSFPKP
ncbi:hypothetical protein TanjilG_10902 [Lupinus angustifolius]|uniref:dof zinc finger protein DOF3.5-like n=1 Tax=Lupinus angustifolius TaxID=3871 RepID=UPI00090D1E2A|nr:PREDICTED: dof zinc finger protein DOF3.5-like [Lupinus angustifolius]OIV90416.1 hypothetical protein TanjilG_10902 [Lupinus angustifolius]